MTTIYTGNLPFSMSESDLERVFAEYGKVTSAKIITNKMNGKSKGYGFVDMENENDADRAINELNGKDVMGRNLKVNKAHPKKEA